MLTNMTGELLSIHPGKMLLEGSMVPFELSGTALARVIGVAPACVVRIVSEQREITADTALRLARYFGTDARS